MNNHVGKLLIAHPNLRPTDWFHKSVIYIYSDDPKQGTLGLLLNRPTNYSLKEFCNQQGVLYPEGVTMISCGGPLNRNSVILLHTDEWHSGNTTTAGPNYKISSDQQMFDRLSIGEQPAYWRMFVGICGWKPGQLEKELSGQPPYRPENSWLTATANDHIMFMYDGEEQWTQALELSSQQMIDSFF